MVPKSLMKGEFKICWTIKKTFSLFKKKISADNFCRLRNKYSFRQDFYCWSRLIEIFCVKQEFFIDCCELFWRSRVPTVMLFHNFSVNKIFLDRFRPVWLSKHDEKLNNLIHEIPYALNSLHNFVIKVPLSHDQLRGYQFILSSVQTTNTLSSRKTQIPIFKNAVSQRTFDSF